MPIKLLFQVDEVFLRRQPYEIQVHSLPINYSSEYPNSDPSSRVPMKHNATSEIQEKYGYKGTLKLSDTPHQETNTHLRQILETNMGEESFASGLDSAGHFQGTRSEQIDAQLSLYNHTVFARIPAADVFYISAIASAPHVSSQPLTISINGWQARIRRNNTIYCCFQGIKQAEVPIHPKIVHWNEPDFKIVSATKYICDISSVYEQSQRFPTKVGLSHSPKCARAQYINVTFPTLTPKPQTPSFGVCAKIIYGDYDAEKVFEWFEITKAMGVDHVSLFTYNVSTEIKKILSHYENEGFVTVNDFDFPLKCK